MKLTLEITDEKLLEQLASLRGDKSAEEFGALCFEHGLKLAEAHRRHRLEAEKHPLLQFPETKQEFRSVEEAAITAALMEKNQENPITAEVNRLVNVYLAQLNTYARQNGNRLPPSMHVKAGTAIQRIALQITAEAVRNTLQGGRKPIAA
jgi:hypothetical protein